MVDDIHLTEEEQIERIKKWWQQNALSIIFGVVGGLALVFGYQYWQQHKITVSEAASAEYQAIVDNDKPNSQALAEASKKFKAEYASTPYAAKVALLSAKHAVDSNALALAAEELQWVMDNTNDEFTQHLARTRLANVLVEQQQLDQAKALIAVKDPGSFQANYAEIEGDIARLNNDYAAAKAAYQKALEAIGSDPYSKVLQLRINQMNSLDH